MKKLNYLLLVSFVCFVLLSAVGSVRLEVNQLEPIILIEPPENFVVNSTIPINVVFLGFNETFIDTTTIDSDLTHWYAPRIRIPMDYAGGNFTLDINYFMSNATTLEDDFTSFLSSIAYVIDPPDDLLSYDPTATGAYLFSAVDTITWLDNNINSYFGEINGSYCLYLIDSYTWNYIPDYYYYDFEMLDPDTGLESSENLTICYGGEYPNRGIFIDLSAGPVNYHEGETSEANEGVSATTITPIWEYIFPQDKAIFNANLTEYIQETIDMVFTPSYLYEPSISDIYDLSVYILDNTSLGDIYANPTNYIDTIAVTNALEALIPFADWSTSYSVDYLDNHVNLQQVIKDTYEATDHVVHPNAINPYQPVIDYLDTNRAEFGMTTETIPVFIFAWDEDLYFDFAGALGGAEADANGNPLMVLCGYNPLIQPNSGYTKLIIHEVGHILGLSHPHDGWSWDKYFDTGNPMVQDWLRDLISTPMTYAHQDTVFSTFDYDLLDRGHTIERLNDSWYFLYNANVTLLNKGLTDLDESLNECLTSALINHSLALQFFEQEDFESAFYYANLSYVAAKAYSNYAECLQIITTTTTTTTPITTTVTKNVTTTTTATTTMTTTKNMTTTITVTKTTTIAKNMTDTTTVTTTTTAPGFTILSIVSILLASAIVIRRRYQK